ncbi:MAG: diguanylate cyclase [Candidatus Brocadiales bacterium]|nr:diguanylate cyclase [Candidatus Brocadiales bacterium]
MGKGNILVVDDSPLVLDVMSKLLSANGFEILTAGNGVEAIEKAFRELPDLIILDVMMPRMNGYQACRLLKSDRETCDIPIIMLTVRDQASDKYWGIQTGADAYLSKEFEQTILLKTVETLIQKRQKTHPKKSLIRESSLINAVDIISKVNDLLDKKLFEATVLNEMSSLIEKGVEDFKGTVDIVMDTLAKILGFNVAAITIVEEHDIGGFYKINYPVSDRYLKQVQEYTNNFLKANNMYLGHAVATTVFDADRIKQASDAEEQKIGFFDVPIRHFDRLSGLVVLAQNVSERIDSKEIEFFRNVVRQAYVIIENAWLYNKVKKMAITDSLTNIYNHGFLYECLSKEYARAERYKLPLSFLMLDIDYFKKVNDSYGHPEGDVVLCKLSQIFKNNIRVCDTLGRYGGEEFSIILPEAKMEDAVSLAERIRKEVEQCNFGDANTSIKCTVSIGVSSYPIPDVKNLEDLINRADKALYNAKAEGRNRVSII